MFKVNFLANQAVSAEDINAIGYNLSNTVYTSFEDGPVCGIDSLNSITQQVVTAGVKREDGNNCAVSLTDTGVFIGSGTAFFSNGAVMTIDEDGINLELEDSTQTNYVYLFLNAALNVAGARCTVAMPSGEDYILLAEVTGNAIKTDVNRFCKSKILDAPNTPLVLYNNNEIYYENYESEEKIEQIVVPNLAKYSLAKITYLDYKYRNGTSSNYWYEELEPTQAFIDFRNEFNDEPVFIGLRSGVDYNYAYGTYTMYWRVTGCATGNPISIGMKNYLDDTSTQQAKYYLKLQFDFDNDILSIIADREIRIPQNGLKIELFAGEVQ